MRDGKLELLERVRTWRKASARAIDLTAEVLRHGPAGRMAVFHIAVPDRARQFEEPLRASLPCPDDILIAELGTGVSVYGGAELVGVVVAAGRPL